MSGQSQPLLHLRPGVHDRRRGAGITPLRSFAWVAGCGADAAPVFRIFNPVSQGERFDPKGEYVRQWVPALANLPDKWIHKPWQAPEAELRKAGVELGRSYPGRGLATAVDWRHSDAHQGGADRRAQPTSACLPISMGTAARIGHGFHLQRTPGNPGQSFLFASAVTRR